MLVYIIIMGIIGGLMIYLLNKTNKTDHVGFSLKCKECGFHKGILKCTNCETRERDSWK
jgi:hypothetical protein